MVVAIAHLVLFKFLDGTRADGNDELAPQSYINNVSHLLASVFQVALQTALGVVFVQYLWFVLRRSALPISTIESLFLIRSEPLSFLHLSNLRNTWLLLLIASLIWATYIAAIFPPGALTIGLATQINHTLLVVPTFNASFVSADHIHPRRLQGY